MNASAEPTRGKRGPRKPLINASVIQRAQELLADHRSAAERLAAFQARFHSAPRVMCMIGLGAGALQVYLPAAALEKALVAELAGLEKEAKRLGVELTPPGPLLVATGAEPPLPLLGQRHDAPGAEAEPQAGRAA